MRSAFLFLLLLPHLASAADSLLPLANPSFEEGLQDWTVSGTESNTSRTGTEAASLGQSGLLLQTGSRFEISSTPLPVKAGETYALDFWSSGTGRAAVELVFKDTAGTVLKPAMAKIRKWPAGSTSNGPFWEKTQLAAAAPEPAATLTILIRPSTKDTGGSVKLDDFCLKQLGEIAPMQRGPDGAAPIPSFDPERITQLEKEINADPVRGKAPPKIVVKLDDLGPRNGNVHAKWQKVADYAKEKNIPVTFGIVAKDMEQEAPAFFQWVKERHAEGGIEFWNHGYDHAEWKDTAGKSVQEFKGSGYEHQKKHLSEANRLAREKLGFPFASFGAPFNATDADTARALEEEPDIQVWMYGDPAQPAGKKVLERCYAVTIESPTFIPNYGDFLEGYAHNRGAEYFVLQGHPTHWNDERWNQFTKILDFLIAQKAVFVQASSFAP